jgi:hypothetical protein
VYDYWVTVSTLDAAFCQEKLNNKLEAEKLYNLVLEKHSDDEFGEKAKEGLERIK